RESGSNDDAAQRRGAGAAARSASDRAGIQDSGSQENAATPFQVPAPAARTQAAAARDCHAAKARLLRAGFRVARGPVRRPLPRRSVLERRLRPRSRRYQLRTAVVQGTSQATRGSRTGTVDDLDAGKME